MLPEFCPQCRTVRVGALRFCRACGFDYDGLPPADVAPSPDQPAPTPAIAAPQANQSAPDPAVPAPLGSTVPSASPGVSGRRTSALKEGSPDLAI